ncbi:hypothetical protein BT69DRAFT_1277857 [Atractiella rhizophila]|nr:hypothetical protein BT69DRAFT_1277857 [Atractiella rhizophila]
MSDLKIDTNEAVEGQIGRHQGPSSPASVASFSTTGEFKATSAEAYVLSPSYALSPSESAFSLDQHASPTFQFEHEVPLSPQSVQSHQEQEATPVHTNGFADVKGRSSSEEEGEDEMERLRRENARLRKLVEDAYESPSESEGKEKLLPHFLKLQAKHSALQEAHADLSHNFHVLSAEVESLRSLKAGMEETKKELVESKETVAYLRKGLEEARRTANAIKGQHTRGHSRTGSFGSQAAEGMNKRFSVASSFAGLTSSSSTTEDDTTPSTPTSSSANRRSIQMTPKGPGNRRQFSLSLSLNSDTSNVPDPEVFSPGGGLLPLRLASPLTTSRPDYDNRRLSSSTLGSLSEHDEDALYGPRTPSPRSVSPLPSPGLKVPNGTSSSNAAILKLKDEHEREISGLKDRINLLSKQLLEAEEGRQASENLLKVLREFMAGNKEAAKKWAERGEGEATEGPAELVMLPPLPTEADPDMEPKPTPPPTTSKWTLPRFGSFGSRAAAPTKPPSEAASTPASVREEPLSPLPPDAQTPSSDGLFSPPPSTAASTSPSIFSAAAFNWGRKSLAKDEPATPVTSPEPELPLPPKVDAQGTITSSSNQARRKFPSFSFGAVFGKAAATEDAEKGLPAPPPAAEEEAKGLGISQVLTKQEDEQIVEHDGDIGGLQMDRDDPKTPVLGEQANKDAKVDLKTESPGKVEDELKKKDTDVTEDVGSAM